MQLNRAACKRLRGSLFVRGAPSGLFLQIQSGQFLARRRSRGVPSAPLLHDITGRNSLLNAAALPEVNCRLPAHLPPSLSAEGAHV